MKHILSIVALSAMLLGASQFATADGPKDGSIIIGVETGQSYGASGMYQINEMIQVGTGLGFQLNENSTAFYLSPQARFLLAIGMPSTSLMLDAQLRLLFGDAEQTNLVIRAGLQHWLSKSVALYGGFALLDVGFSPSYTAFGFMSPFVGAQFAL